MHAIAERVNDAARRAKNRATSLPQPRRAQGNAATSRSPAPAAEGCPLAAAASGGRRVDGRPGPGPFQRQAALWSSTTRSSATPSGRRSRSWQGARRGDVARSDIARAQLPLRHRSGAGRVDRERPAAGARRAPRHGGGLRP